MILGSVCIGFIVLLVQSVEGEKEASCAAGETGARHCQQNPAAVPSGQQRFSAPVCDIIRRDITADAVAITNTEHVLAYVGVGEANYQHHDDVISPTTRQAIRYGKIIIKTMTKPTAHRRSTPNGHPAVGKGGGHRHAKIYYCHAHRITSTLQEMAIGLSQIISTQLEVSRAEQLRRWPTKRSCALCKARLTRTFYSMP